MNQPMLLPVHQENIALLPHVSRMLLQIELWDLYCMQQLLRGRCKNRSLVHLDLWEPSVARTTEKAKGVNGTLSAGCNAAYDG